MLLFKYYCFEVYISTFYWNFLVFLCKHLLVSPLFISFRRRKMVGIKTSVEKTNKKDTREANIGKELKETRREINERRRNINILREEQCMSELTYGDAIQSLEKHGERRTITYEDAIHSLKEKKKRFGEKLNCIEKEITAHEKAIKLLEAKNLKLMSEKAKINPDYHPIFDRPRFECSECGRVLIPDQDKDLCGVCRGEPDWTDPSIDL